MPDSDISATTLSSADIQLFPSDYCAEIDLAAAFSRPAPVQVDIGSGDGGFLLAMAKRHPECNFIGTERLLGRVRKTCRKAANAGLTNVRMLRIENLYAIRYLLPAGSISVFHLLFPDPWPKRKHWRRRLFNTDFLDAVHRALVPGGEIRIKTDDPPYFEQMQEIFNADARYELVEWIEEPDYPKTDFEQHFMEKGLPIQRARLLKRS